MHAHPGPSSRRASCHLCCLMLKAARLCVMCAWLTCLSKGCRGRDRASLQSGAQTADSTARGSSAILAMPTCPASVSGPAQGWVVVVLFLLTCCGG